MKIISDTSMKKYFKMFAFFFASLSNTIKIQDAMSYKTIQKKSIAEAMIPPTIYFENLCLH